MHSCIYYKEKEGVFWLLSAQPCVCLLCAESLPSLHACYALLCKTPAGLVPKLQRAAWKRAWPPRSRGGQGKPKRSSTIAGVGPAPPLSCVYITTQVSCPPIQRTAELSAWAGGPWTQAPAGVFIAMSGAGIAQLMPIHCTMFPERMGALVNWYKGCSALWAGVTT